MATAGRQADGAMARSPRSRPRQIADRMIRIAITEAAFDAIATTLPLGSVSYENAVNARGGRYVWLPPNLVDRLKAQRRPGESYSDVILRLLAAGDGIEGTCAR